MRSDDELLDLLSSCPQWHSRWQHYKGAEYLVLAAAIDEATLQPLVIYRATSGNGVCFARPLAEWTGTVLVDGAPTPRYTCLT